MATSRPLGTTDRLRLVPSATRRLGAELLVSAGGATRPVQLLSGVGPSIWRCLEEGLTLAEAVDRLARETGTTGADVEQDVLRFATSLVDARLAERVP